MTKRSRLASQTILSFPRAPPRQTILYALVLYFAAEVGVGNQERRVQRRRVVLELNNLIKHRLQRLDVRRLREYLVHLVAPRLLDVQVLGMPSARNNHWLHDTFELQVAPDLLGRFVPVHQRHAAINNDKTVRVLHVTDGVLDFLEGFEAVACFIDQLHDVLVACLLQQHFESHQIVRLIVDDQDAPVRDRAPLILAIINSLAEPISHHPRKPVLILLTLLLLQLIAQIVNVHFVVRREQAREWVVALLRLLGNLL